LNARDCTIKLLVAAGLLGSCVAAAGAEPVPARTPAPAAAPSRPGDEAIRRAVREVLDENPDNPRRHEPDTIRGNRYQGFAEQFSEAKVPDCLHSDALKRQPPRIGPIAFKGLYAVPFVVLAKVRGKCL
jgi:hypothetical protein